MTEKILTNLDIIGHFYVAGLPGRHELEEGELNFSFICRKLDDAGYSGYMGIEYIPLKPSRQSLLETRKWLSGK